MEPVQKRRFSIILAVLLVLATGLQFAAAAQKSFWEDEAWTAATTQAGFESILSATARDVHPPLYLVLAGAWGQVFGFNEVALRALSILFVVLALLLTYGLAYDLFGARAALAAVALLGFSPLFLMFGHNARYYSMVVALALLATLCTVRYLDSGRLPYLLVYVFSSVALLYLLFAAAAVILACNLWWLSGWQQPRFRARLLPWLLAQVASGLLYLPVVGILALVLERYPETPALSPGLLLELLKRTLYLGFVFGVGETLSPLNPLAWLGLGVIVLVAGFALAAHGRSRRAWLPVLFLAVIGAANILVSLNATVAQTWQNLSYRALYALPFLAIWLGLGLAALRPRLALALSAVLLVVYGAGILNYFNDTHFIRPIYAVPWRAVYSMIQSQAQPGTEVICNQADYTCAYYARRFGFQPRSPGNWPELAAQAPTQVWWIHSNLAAAKYDEQRETNLLQEIRQAYPNASVYNYGLQDESIRWIKTNLMGQEDYEYRVNVFKFY